VARGTVSHHDRQARHDQRTKDYLAKRLSDGKTKAEAIRCLKRCIAREAFNALPRETRTLT
jgi:transposase